MKTNSSLSVLTVEMHGSQFGKRTGWQTWPGFSLAKLSDGSTRWFPADHAINGTLDALDKAGISTVEMRARMVAAEKARAYPDKPESAEMYQHNYGYEKPVALDNWQWSVTFGRWSRLVTFADGWRGYTYPKL